MKSHRIAVAGTGYVGLSLATLLAQHNHVTAVDVIPEKVDLINRRRSPIQDEYIEKYLAEFKHRSMAIVANCYERCKGGVRNKVYTRDLFGRD